MINSEPKPMREIHEIMEKIYEEEKKMSQKEILENIHESSKQLIKEHGLKLRRAERRTKVGT